MQIVIICTQRVEQIDNARATGEEKTVDIVQPTGITIEFITTMVVVVAIITTVLLGVLTYQIYASNQPKQRASVEPEVDDNNELT